MSDDLIQKIVSGVLRGITGLIVTGGSYQLFDGQWYGNTIFESYLEQHTVQILTRPPSGDLYGAFAFESVPLGLRGAGAILFATSVVVGLVLLAHIVAKPSVSQLSGSAERPARSARRRDVMRWCGLCRFVYIRYQPIVTLLLFLATTAMFFSWPFERGIALGFLIAALPMALYLLLYPTDLAKGGFLDRFAYIGVLVLLVVVLFGWPRQYGSTVFDPDFPIASGVGDLDHCDNAQLLKGPSFIAFESGADQLLFRLCFDRQGSKQYVDFFGGNNQQIARAGTAKLSQVIKTFVRPADNP